VDFSTLLKKFDIGNLNETSQTKLKKNLKQYIKNKDKDKVDIKFDDTETKVLERTENYNTMVKDIGKYQERVKINREADVLDFSAGVKHNQTAKAIASGAGDNGFEKEIKDLLVKNRYDTDDKIIEQENEKLLAVDPEDLKRRYEEMKKVRGLLFQQEMEHKRKSKIKSKLYHKIQKKKREKQENEILAQLQEVDPEGVKRYLEKQKMGRIKERIELKHSINSKFSKTVKRYNLQSDVNVKEAIKENFKLRDELMKKIKGLEDDEEEGGHNEENEEDEEAYEEEEEMEAAEDEESIEEDKLLINFDEGEKDKPKEEKKTAGVFGMKFMQNNTIESKLKDVLGEIGNDSDDQIEDDDRKSDGEDEFEVAEPIKKGKHNARRKNVLDVIPKKKQQVADKNAKLTSNVTYSYNH
jgi:U3 small nucleolar RNA-associated protein 14